MAEGWLWVSSLRQTANWSSSLRKPALSTNALRTSPGFSAMILRVTEDAVLAVFGPGLGDHFKFDVGGVAAVRPVEFGVALLDFDHVLARQREFHVRTQLGEHVGVESEQRNGDVGRRFGRSRIADVSCHGAFKEERGRKEKRYRLEGGILKGRRARGASLFSPRMHTDEHGSGGRTT